MFTRQILDSPRQCKPGIPQFSVTFTEGNSAGNFVYLEMASNISECIKHACAHGEGDYAYLMEDRCFAVECYPEKTCALKHSVHLTVIAPLKWSGRTVTIL